MKVQWGNPDKRRIAELEEEIKDLQLEHDIELRSKDRENRSNEVSHNHKHQALIADMTNLKEDHAKEVARIKESHQFRVDKLVRDHEYASEVAEQIHSDELEDYQTRLDTLTSLKNSHEANVRDRAKIDAERAVFESERAAFGEMKSAVKRAVEDKETEVKASYKNGYGDGVADGLRKVFETTQGDRQAMVDLINKVLESQPEPQAIPAPQILVLGPGSKPQEAKKQ